LPIAQELRAAGYRPVCILRDISRAEEVLGGQGIEYLQAPVWLTQFQGLPNDLNFTETMFRFGFLKPEGLTALVHSWRRLWSLLNVDLLLIDHAPSACLAARGLGIPRILIGNSFAIPPRVSPLPPFRWWQNNSGERPRLQETEQRTVLNINACAQRTNTPTIAAVHELFDCEETLICGWPELDVYGAREHAEHIGPINNTNMGASPIWPLGEKKRVFAYIKPQYRHFDALLAAMSQVDAQFLIFAPGIAEATARKFTKSGMLFSTTPFNMQQVVKACDLVVCHAGGTTDVALDAGIPVLQLPMQMEQTMTSRRSELLGCSLHLPLDGNPGELRKLFKKLLSEPAYTDAAKVYARRIDERQGADSLGKLLDRCATYLATTKS
jgi:UDP:flavonoid glycosyltransferase YjiC (YdhE family)